MAKDAMASALLLKAQEVAALRGQVTDCTEHTVLAAGASLDWQSE